jgi:hypothetical protein
MKKLLVLAIAGLFAAPVFAAAIDGTKRLICTTEELKDCVAGTECLNGLPAEYGAPTSHRKSKIRDLEKKDGQLLLQGRELGYGWTIAIEQKNGDMTLSLVNREGAFVLFGRCAAI